MWIHYIGEIAIGVFVGLMVLHFGVTFYFKWLKKRQTQQAQDHSKNPS